MHASRLPHERSFLNRFSAWSHVSRHSIATEPYGPATPAKLSSVGKSKQWTRVHGSRRRTMRARYAEYKAGRVSEDEMCGEMVTMHKGMSEAVMMKAATEFMGSVISGTNFSRDAGIGSAPARERLRNLGGFVVERMGHSRRDEAVWHC